MTPRRVVVTGMGAVTPLGADWATLGAALRDGRSGITPCPELAEVEGVKTRWAGRVDGPEWPKAWPRRRTRGMGRVARLAALATDAALEEAGLTGSDLLRDGSTGLAHGSTLGSPDEFANYAHAIVMNRTTEGIVPVQYLRGMSHTTAANLAAFYKIRGGVHTTCSACTSGSQAIGVGYEQIRFGRQERMICGGAEEWHTSEVAVFDLLFATSTRDDATPRPFDRGRDGLVVSEGAATLVLEEREAALARGAPILAELIGYATTCDGRELVSPHQAGMEAAMRRGLADAGIEGSEVDYLNAHATATEVGDLAESAATLAVYGDRVPTSSLKGHLGHSLGACGAIEACATIRMLREGWAAPTLHLEDPDPHCAPLDYIRAAPRALDARIAVSNNFAFGGINTSLVIRLDAGSASDGAAS